MEKKTQVERNHSEEKFQALFENSPIGVAYHRMVYDDQGKPVDYFFLDANANYLELTGVDPRGKMVTEAFPGIEKDPFDWIGTFGKVAVGGETIRFQQYLEPNDRWYDCVGFQSSPDHFVAAFLEITEQKRAEEKLKELATVTEQAVDGIAISNLEGIITFTNRSWAAIHGYDSNEELLGRHMSIFHSEEQFMNDVALFNEVVMREGHNEGEASHMRKDGSTFPAMMTCTLLKDENYVASGFVRVMQDITERKLAEEALLRAQNYISNIVNSMPSVLVGVDPEGIVTQWNIEAEKATGLSSEEAVGLKLGEAFPQLDSGMGRVRKAMQLREPQIDSRRARTEGGNTRYQDVTVYPLTANGIEGAVIRVDDVTERVRIEEMMVQSEKMLSVGGLAAGMAHEINNPLGGMIQTADVMRSRLTDAELPANTKSAEEAGTTMEEIQAFMESRNIVEMLNRICESGNRAAEIVSNMLSFSRKSDSSRSSHDLATLLDQCVDLAGADYDLKKQHDFRRIEIVREYDRDLPLVPCESGKIQQVLLNILRNGAEAMGSDEPRFLLRLAHEAKAGMIRIEIEDNGPGMDMETRRRVFEPFFTTKTTNRGTGLGLSVSYFIITENHDGEMSVESNPGKGAKFTIRLPVETG